MDKNLLSKGYEFSEVEDKWIQHWSNENCFEAEMTEGKPAFSIVMEH